MSMKSILKKMFDSFNQKNIKYCVIRHYDKLPNKIPTDRDVDLIIEKTSLKGALKIINSLNFTKYPFTQPHLFYYKYDDNLGLIQLDIVKVEKLTGIIKFKNFFIPKKNSKYENFRVKKRVLFKIITSFLRKFYFIFKGEKLFCIVGPDGCGKTSTVNYILKILKNYPVKIKKIYFGRKKLNNLHRTIDLSYKLILIYYNLFLGRIVLTDRYIYLTFRNNRLLKKLILLIFPRPDRVYLLKNRPELIFKRKKETSIKKIAEILSFLEKIDNVTVIMTNKSIERVAGEIAKDILQRNCGVK